MTTELKERQLSLGDELGRHQPPADWDMSALIKLEHRRAELQRLNSSLDGCGCALCQELYASLDLSRYGSRVTHSGDCILIIAGKTGADPHLIETADRWSADDSVFIHHGQSWGVSKSGRRVLLKDSSLASQDGQEAVSKLLPDSLKSIPTPKQAQKRVVMKHRGGRPKKQGQVSRATSWRRRKRAK